MSTWFLLARRPGWRLAVQDGVDATAADGALRLAPLPRPGVLDGPVPTVLDLPCCERAVVRHRDRTVALVAGTGQTVAVAGPWGLVRPADGAPPGPPVEAVHPAHPAWLVPHDGGDALRAWPGGTWEPVGLVDAAALAEAGATAALGVLDAEGTVHLLDRRARWCGALPGGRVPGRPLPDDGPRVVTTGTVVTEPLDSGAPGTRWHRVALRGEVPTGTRVRVAVLVTDADLTSSQVASLDPGRWSDVGVMGDPGLTAWDALVRAEPGRWLRLRLTLEGDGTATPVVHDAEVHLPRDTSLRYLPAVHASGESDVLERFLALTDTVRASVTRHLDDTPRQLDPRSADASPARDLLGWIGSWIGMTGTEALPEARRRRLVAAAPELYRRRGTPDGVARHVGMWVARPAAVLEHHRLRRWAVLDHGRLADATRLFGRDVVRRLRLDGGSAIGAFRLVSTPSPRTDPFAVHAHRFTLIVRAGPGDDVDALGATASRVLAVVQPAHTVGTVAVVGPTARVGEQASLGLDAVVAGAPPPAHVGDRLAAGRLVPHGATDPAGTAPVGVALARDPRRGDLRSIGIDARVGTRAG